MKNFKLLLTSFVVLVMGFMLVPVSASAAGPYVLPLNSKSYNVSSHYGPRCIPIANGTTMHLGEDMGTANGSPIYSIASGTVSHTRQGTNSQSGYIVVRSTINGETIFLEYVHMWDATKYVRIGSQVSAGQRIADVGSSGPSTAPHLHLGVWRNAYYGNGQHLEPVGYLRNLGVDINGHATRVVGNTTPSSCIYRTTGDLNVRSGPGTNYPVLAVAPSGTQMTHIPGRIENKFIPVNIMGINGWVSSGYIAFVRSNYDSTPPPPPPPPVVPPTVFVDVLTNNQFAKEIVWMHTAKISTGWGTPSGPEYRPLANVNRDAMAAFLYRAAGSPGYTAPSVSPFIDVSTSNQFYKEISWLASTGISTGWSTPAGPEFRPVEPINRDAMAAFLYRAAKSPGYNAPGNSPFLDVSTSHQFYKEISWLAASNISTGWGSPGRAEYRPDNQVARDAMAAFLYRMYAR